MLVAVTSVVVRNCTRLNVGKLLPDSPLASLARPARVQRISTKPSHLFADLGRGNGSACRLASARGVASMEELDETQVRLMAEECIVVDPDDKVIGAASKKACHLNENIDKGYWANTCCSHPLSFPEELEERDHLGVRRAAQRKLKHELGVEPEQVPLDDFHYLTRIQYQAQSDGKWGEHEIDYILFIQKEVDLKPEPNEVQQIRFIGPTELEGFLQSAESNGTKISPWFKLIATTLLPDWWKSLDNVKSLQNHATIHRM